MAEGSALCPIEIGGDDNEVDIDLLSISTPEEDEKDAEMEPPRKRLHMQGASSTCPLQALLSLSFVSSLFLLFFPPFLLCFPPFAYSEEEEPAGAPNLTREREEESEELVSGA